MKTWHRWLTLALLGVTNLAGAAPPFVDGNVLVAAFAGDEVRRTFTMAYVVGVVDAANGAKIGGSCFSIPENVTIGQLADIVRQYLERNPSGRHFPAAWLVGSALEQAFPCRK